MKTSHGKELGQLRLVGEVVEQKMQGFSSNLWVTANSKQHESTFVNNSKLPFKQGSTSWPLVDVEAGNTSTRRPACLVNHNKPHRATEHPLTNLTAIT